MTTRLTQVSLCAGHARAHPRFQARLHGGGAARRRYDARQGACKSLAWRGLALWLTAAPPLQPVRKFAVQSMVLLLLDPKVMIGQGLLTIADVLCAACWITGEYASFLEGISELEDDDDDDDEREDAKRHRARIRAIPTDDLCLQLIDSLTHPRVTNLPAHVQNVYLLNALKIFVHACKHSEPEQIERTIELVDARMGVFMQSVHVEVQERSTTFRQLLVAFGIVAPAEADAPPVDPPAPAAEATANSLIGDLMEAPAAPAANLGAVNPAGGKAAAVGWPC